MNATQDALSVDHRITRALSAEDPSVRLQAALAVGTRGDAAALEVLVERCAIEPDFFVRDMLSWALTRLPSKPVLDRLRGELESDVDQARSQALHTLSKIADKRTFEWITPELLADPSNEVARTAWRAAVVLVLEGQESELARDLAQQLGRGDHELQLSLSRALIGLGDAACPVLADGVNSPNPQVAAHSRATELLGQDPSIDFAVALQTAGSQGRPGTFKVGTAPNRDEASEC